MLDMIIKNHTLWWLLVSSSSTNLLNVIVETLRHTVMDNEPNILLIDAHAECNCGNNDVDLFFHPAFLDLLSLFFPILQASKLFIAPGEVVIGLKAQFIKLFR